MAKLDKKDKEAKEYYKVECAVCGEVARDGNGDWEPGPIYHCNGKSAAFGAKLQGQHHHSRLVLHKPCMVCGAFLGCPRCSGPSYELLCLAQVTAGGRYQHDAAHWGHPAALKKHGRLLLEPQERRDAMAFLHSAVERVGKNR